MWIAIHWVCCIDTNRRDKISMHRDAPVNRYTPSCHQSKNSLWVLAIRWIHADHLDLHFTRPLSRWEKKMLKRNWQHDYRLAPTWLYSYQNRHQTFHNQSQETGLGSIPFFQFNSNSNSVIFNSNSNSNSTTHNKFQFQFQFRRFQFQFQFQFRRFQIPAISILEMTCWCLPWNLIKIILTRYMHIKLLLLIPSVSYPLLNGYNYMASWLILYQ